MDKMGGLWYFPLENVTSVPGVGGHRDQTCAWESLKTGWQLMPQEGEVAAVGKLLCTEFFRAKIWA